MRTIPVLCVDPLEEDPVVLQEIFGSSPWGMCPDSLWKLQTSRSLTSAWRALHTHRFPLILCERDLQPGTWRELLDLIERLPQPPFLVVTSRAADERLWAEALNLGAYDVLAKPFDRTEVMRVVSMAWAHWTARHGAALEAPRMAVGGAA
ncbi:MAG TPA: response regulator [Bryobacteraceae bacterium]|nr:response regulator [Bryobacteraceae bacterium]